MAGTTAVAPAERTDQVRFDGLLYPCAQIRYVPTARFGRRVTFGDASRDSDDVISVDILFDWSGGGQVETRNEGSDQGRFWWATLDTRRPYALCLAAEVVEVAAPAAVDQNLLLSLHWSAGSAEAWPLADLGGVHYGEYDLQVTAWDETDDVFEAVAGALLDNHPVNRAVAFGATGAGSAAVLWVPQGAEGYQTFDGATVAAQVTTVTPVGFAEFNDLLWALSTDGVLSSWDGAAWAAFAQLDARHTPINLLVNRVADDEYALHAVTDHGLLVYNEVNDVWLSTNLSWEVAHPGCGRASSGWAGGGGQPSLADGTGAAGGDLYVASAMQTHRYTLGSTIAPIGPQRDHGLPPSVRGQTASMVGEKNGLYLLIEGDAMVGGAADEFAFSEMGWNEDAFVAGATTAYSALMVWTGVGWHTAWVSPDASGTPTLVTVSGASDAYRLWWGYGGRLYTIALPRDDHLPRQGLEAGIDRFQPTGYLETAWFDAQMDGFEKLASHFQVNVLRDGWPTDGDAWDDGLAVVVKYEVDDDEDWTTLGTVDGPGRRRLSFGFEGVSFQRIRFRVELSSDSATASPLVDSMILHFQKIPHNAGAWEVTVPLENLDQSYGRTALEMFQEMDALLVKRGFVRFTLGGLDYRVSVAGMQGALALGDDPRGTFTLSVIEIVDEADEPAEVA